MDFKVQDDTCAELVGAMKDLSWSMYKPVSTVTKIVRHPDETHPFKKVSFEPLTSTDLERLVLHDMARIEVGWRTCVGIDVGAPGKATSLGQVLEALDQLLDTAPSAEMLADWKDKGGLEVAQADRVRWQAVKEQEAREPTIFEKWDGNEGSIVVRHVIGNIVCAFFEGLRPMENSPRTLKVCIGT